MLGLEHIQGGACRQSVTEGTAGRRQGRFDAPPIPPYAILLGRRYDIHRCVTLWLHCFTKYYDSYTVYDGIAASAVGGGGGDTLRSVLLRHMSENQQEQQNSY